MKGKLKLNIYDRAQHFADVTKVFIAQGQIQRVKKCLQIAENLFVHGTNEVKNVVSNIYLFSVSSALEIYHCNTKELLPPSLKIEYYKQINASGI